MKIIRYQLMTKVNSGTEDFPENVQQINDCEIRCDESDLERNIELAKSESYNGKYFVEDFDCGGGGQTQEKRIAELEEALELLLSGVTE